MRTTKATLTALLGVVVLVLALLPAYAGHAAAAPSGDKGSVGWDAYRRLDRLPDLASGTQTKQFSSFDRSGGNGDFSHCLTTTADGCVIAQHTGPGEVDSIWFTRDGGDVTRTGNITVTLDGTTVLHAPLQDVVDGKAGAPFVHPLVANADQSSGGVYIIVPMPFRSSMRITTDVDPIYYHVTYRTFPDADGVSTFDPGDKADDVVAKLDAAGTADPKPAQPGAQTTSSPFTVAPGKTTTLADAQGPGAITALRLHLPQLVGATPQPPVTDDGRAFGSGGSSRFTVKLDPANTGVTLTRRLDPGIGHQKAKVLVDGTAVGEWQPMDPRGGSQWADQSVQLPASVTAGKSSITVENDFESSDLDYNEFTYWADSEVGGKAVRTDTVDVGPDHTDSEQAHGYRIAAQTWEGERTYTYPPSDDEQQKVKPSDAVLAGARLRISFDGQRLVDSPLGEFFGTGLGLYPVRSLMFGVDPKTDTLSAWWPMPFRQHVRVELYNASDVPITSSTATTTVAPGAHWADDLAPTGDAGYFRATSNRQQTVRGQDYDFLQAIGRGRFVGVSHTMQGVASRGYLEGDERVYADGAHTPQLHGTGTEDLYEGGWYFNRGPFTHPVNGESANEGGAYGCPSGSDCTSAYRLMLNDAVPFSDSLTFGIEHGGVDDQDATYASTAYWYGKTGDGAALTDTVDVGNADSERAHAYDDGGAARTELTDTYEGNDGTPVPVRDDLRAGTSPVSFRLAVAENNDGVVLRRTSDQMHAYQAAAVSVDGTPAGTWTQPLGNSAHRWLDDDFTLPASLTRGKSRVTVTLEPAKGGPAWSAARYDALSLVPQVADHTAPGAVSDLVGAPDGNAVTLTWKPAHDDVPGVRYEVYASTRQGFTPSNADRVGGTDLPAFTHSGLGLEQTWYYRVRAVDAAGNTGPYSPEVTATTGDTQRIEAESLLPAKDADAPVEAQGNCCGITWSGNAQLWFRPTAANHHVTLDVTVPTTGTYDLSAVQTRAGDYGVNTLAVDGTQVGEAYDAYDNGVALSAPLSYGSVRLTAGHHDVTLTVTGKNASSSGYLAGVDYLDFRLTS